MAKCRRLPCATWRLPRVKFPPPQPPEVIGLHDRLRLARHAPRLSAVLHQCQGRDLFHKAKRWTEDTRLLQKLAITVTHPFRRIRSFEDCLADEAGRCEPFSAPKNTLLAGKIAGNLHLPALQLASHH